MFGLNPGKDKMVHRISHQLEMGGMFNRAKGHDQITNQYACNNTVPGTQ